MPNSLPLNWCECKFSDLCDIYTGNSINEQEKVSKYTNLDSGYNYIGTKDVSFEQTIDYENGVKIPFDNGTFKIAPKNTPLLCIEGGSAGRKLAFTEENICFGNKLCAFVSKNKITSLYIFYFLQSTAFRSIFSLNKNGLIGGVSLNKIKNLMLPLPPLAEQERIVAKIEALFAGIDEGVEHLKSAQAQIKQYRQSVLKSAFEGKLYKTTDWKEVPLKKVCEFKSGNTIDTKLEKSSGSIPYIKVGDMNLSENSISIVTSSRFVDMVDIKQNQLIPTGSVIFPKRGGAIATNKKRKVIKPIIIDLNTMAIIPSDKLYTDFFYFWILKIDLMKLSNGGNIPQINNYSFDKVNIPLPTLPEQQRIVTEIEKRFAVADELEKAVNEGLEKADKLKQSILKKAFEGKLAPQNPNDEPASALLERIKKSQPPTKGKKK